jgi:acyl-CoA reductase-like NAD-dependent aldehyde dehydrogenase
VDYISKALRVAHSMRAGMIYVNTYGNVDPAVTFGGFGMSGWGSELGLHGVDGYLNTKAV